MTHDPTNAVQGVQRTDSTRSDTYTRPQTASLPVAHCPMPSEPDDDPTTSCPSLSLCSNTHIYLSCRFNVTLSHPADKHAACRIVTGDPPGYVSGRPSPTTQYPVPNIQEFRCVYTMYGRRRRPCRSPSALTARTRLLHVPAFSAACFPGLRDTWTT